MQYPKIIKNAFTKEQRFYIYDLIQSQYHNLKPNLYAERGRDDLDLTPNGTQSLKADLRDTVLHHFDDGYYISNLSYGEYNNKHINQLPL